MKFLKVRVPAYLSPIVLFLAFIINTNTLFGQAETSTAPQSLSEQFQEMKDKSETFNEYKVIKAYKLNAFWKNVSDSLSTVKGDLIVARQEITSLKGEIASLKDDLAETKEMLTQSETKNNSIAFLGADINKAVYNIILWGIILGLAVLAVSLYYAFKSSHKVTRKAKKEFEKVSADFENYRKLSQEKQIKLKRELQTEVNKVEELLEKYERRVAHS